MRKYKHFLKKLQSQKCTHSDPILSYAPLFAPDAPADAIATYCPVQTENPYSPRSPKTNPYGTAQLLEGIVGVNSPLLFPLAFTREAETKSKKLGSSSNDPPWSDETERRAYLIRYAGSTVRVLLFVPFIYPRVITLDLNLDPTLDSNPKPRNPNPSKPQNRTCENQTPSLSSDPCFVFR